MLCGRISVRESSRLCYSKHNVDVDVCTISLRDANIRFEIGVYHATFGKGELGMALNFSIRGKFGTYPQEPGAPGRFRTPKSTNRVQTAF